MFENIDIDKLWKSIVAAIITLTLLIAVAAILFLILGFLFGQAPILGIIFLIVLAIVFIARSIYNDSNLW